MKLFELTDNSFYDPTNDKISRTDINNTRKQTLTIRHLNKLRHLRAIKKLDDINKRNLYGKMYGLSLEEHN